MANLGHQRPINGPTAFRRTSAPLLRDGAEPGLQTLAQTDFTHDGQYRVKGGAITAQDSPSGPEFTCAITKWLATQIGKASACRTQNGLGTASIPQACFVRHMYIQIGTLLSNLTHLQTDRTTHGFLGNPELLDQLCRALWTMRARDDQPQVCLLYTSNASSCAACKGTSLGRLKDHKKTCLSDYFRSRCFLVTVRPFPVRTFKEQAS